MTTTEKNIKLIVEFMVEQTKMNKIIIKELETLNKYAHLHG